MALPNGGCAPFVGAIDLANSGTSKEEIIVDLSADYRFQCGEGGWTYGLPGENV